MDCCICGTVKNWAPFLNKIFENMEKIGYIFNNYVIIIYYDKSDDDSLMQLENYQNKNNKLELLVNTTPLYKYRTHNLAKARNSITQRIQQKYSSFKYFIMMDCDDVCAYEVNT
jgi:hypothetical protein